MLDGLGKTIAGISCGFDIIGASSPVEILDRIEAGETFDLILCDLIMDGMNGLAFLSAVNARRIKTPILLMSGIAIDPPLQQMRRLGAKGFVHKSADPDQLAEIIKAVLSGQKVFPAENAAPGQTKDTTLDTDELEAVNRLTSRQLEVLRALANGFTNQEISDQLSISPNTVKTHIKHLYDAMGVSRRTACLQKARLYGII